MCGQSLPHVEEMLHTYVHKTLHITSIDAREISKGEWEERAVLLVLPGGRDLPYLRKLRGRGNASIKRFVKNGGSYLGICAGAYYSSKKVIFHPHHPLEVIGERPLGFFKGPCIGPLLAPYAYHHQRGSRLPFITFHNLPLFYTAKEKEKNCTFNPYGGYLYYHGGGHFSKEHLYKETVLATYPHGEISIIATSYGKGKVILSGVHFEYQWHHFAKEHPFFQRLYHTRNAQHFLIRQIFSYLGI